MLFGLYLHYDNDIDEALSPRCRSTNRTSWLSNCAQWPRNIITSTSPEIQAREKIQKDIFKFRQVESDHIHPLLLFLHYFSVLPIVRALNMSFLTILKSVSIKFLFTNMIAFSLSFVRGLCVSVDLALFSWVSCSLLNSTKVIYFSLRTSSEASLTIWLCYSNSNHYHYSFFKN